MIPSSPVEAVAAAYERLRENQPAAWISVVPGSEALARAARLEEEGRRDRRLWGVPFAVKDNIDVAGMTTTAGCPAFAYTASATAPAVAALLDAGAVLVGKTNLDQFATGLVGTRSPYGVCHSELDPSLISGGSSSGSAVAVAAGVVPFALGTDTAGSGRVPAAANGIVGLKPTRGLVSTEGVVPACRSWDCVSIFARTVDNAAVVLEVLTGSHPHPSTPASVVVGIPPSSSWGLSLPQESAFTQTIAQLEAATWAEVREFDPTPLLEAGRLLYEGSFVAERLTVIGPLLAKDPDALDPTVRQVVTRGLSYNATDVFTDLHRLTDLRTQMAELWQALDAIVCPTVPDLPTHQAVASDPVGTNAALGRWTQAANLLDLSATTVPSGTRLDNLPGSATVLTPANTDSLTAAIARRLHPHREPGPPG